MHPWIADGDSRLQFWSRVREFAVPTSMIESSTARRAVGDWRGACAAAHVDVDLNLRAVAGTHGHHVAAQLRADLRHLAPDLLRWHFPMIAPDGRLRPDLTVTLARYPAGAVHLVARTAAAEQRITLTLWNRDGPRPDPRFRIDLHRHLWDARRTDELRDRSGAATGDYATDRWPAEAALLLQAEGRQQDAVNVRLGTHRWLVLHLRAGPPTITTAIRPAPGLPILPDAATWVPPDLALLRAGLIDADLLHPLVASALVPGYRPTRRRDAVRIVECRGARHRIGLVDGVLVPLDHDADEIRREELLVALGGAVLPCLQEIDESADNPVAAAEVRTDRTPLPPNRDNDRWVLRGRRAPRDARSHPRHAFR